MNKRVFWVLAIISTASLLGQAVIYPFLPAVVPIHWGTASQPDNWGPKIANLLLAALPLALLVFLRFMPRLDPRYANYKNHAKAYSALAVAVTLLLIFVGWFASLYALGLHLPIGFFVLLMVGLLMVVLGNYMPQIRPNYFFGIKTPWALANPEVWRKTHRFGGIVFCAAGLVILISAFLPGTLAVWATVGSAVCAALVPAAYSYFIFKKINPTTQEDSHAEH
ncbi:MAG: SdpI family protein [Oscillospiraceae bacterium]